jgi:hypothetical protein
VLASTKNYNSQSDAREAQHKASCEEPIGALGHVMPQQKARELEPPQPQSDASGLGGQVSAEWYKGMSTYAISLSGRNYCYNGKKYTFRHASLIPCPFGLPCSSLRLPPVTYGYRLANMPARSKESQPSMYCGQGHSYHMHRVYGIG